MAVAERGTAERLFEQPVKMALVFVADGLDDLRHAQLRFREQALGNVQPLFDEQFLKGLPEQQGDAAGEVFLAVSEFGGELCERRVRIALLDVGGNRLFQPRFGGGYAQAVAQRVAVIGEVRKEQGNDLRQYGRIVGRMLYDGIDEVIHQIADGEVPLRAEVEVFSLAVGCKISREEFAHDGVVLHVMEYVFQKIVGNDKIKPDVALFGAQNAVPYMAVQKQYIAAAQRNFFRADQVRHAARINVHELHVVVAVFGEVDKARMQAQIDLLIAAEQPLFVDDKGIRQGIIVLSDIFLSA